MKRLREISEKVAHAGAATVIKAALCPKVKKMTKKMEYSICVRPPGADNVQVGAFLPNKSQEREAVGLSSGLPLVHRHPHGASWW